MKDRGLKARTLAMDTIKSRRAFLRQSTALGGLMILPSGIVRGATPPSSRLNIALIGAFGRAASHYGWLEKQNVVACCDVVEANLKPALERFPNAKTFIDWRKCLDHPGLDAVVVCTVDHHHALISNWALQRDLHVFCEKPHAISVEEARLLRKNWLAKKGKLATQVGTQMHAQENYRRVKEMLMDGAIGQLESVVAWGNRKHDRKGYLTGGANPPEGVHWDLWLGPAPDRPYHPDYFVGRPGANCLRWNMFRDWGSSQIGDMGSHMMDLVYSTTDAALPTRIRASGDPYHAEVYPVAMECHFDHPANDWRGPIRISWQQGGKLPHSPRAYIDLDKIGHGVMFKGSEGFIIANYSERMLIPSGRAADLSYYKPRNRGEQPASIGDFYQNWIDACKDPSKPTCCDFEYHGNLAEQLQLGLVAHQAGVELEYDAENGVCTNHPEANALFKRSYRDGWGLNG